MNKIRKMAEEIIEDKKSAIDRDKPFVDKKEFDKACDDFIKGIRSEIVKIVELGRKYEEKHQYAEFKFEVRLNLHDKFLNIKKYNAGEAYIYLSDDFYSIVDSHGKELFGQKPDWNNIRTTGWFSL